MTDPDITGITDGRPTGQYLTRYPAHAWVQIIIELIFLLSILAIGITCLFMIGYDVTGRDVSKAGVVAKYFEFPKQRIFLIWACIAISGTIGGATFALKWLYHTVAKSMWNQDRIVWRFTVPIISGVLSIFLAFMIVSGIVPFLSRTAFNNFYVALGFGFFTGYFSDHVLAALQRLAQRTFGTVDDPPGEKK